MRYIDAAVTHTEIDLGSIPYTEWPERAKTLARAVVSRWWREYERELPEMRHAWLAERVALMSRPIDDL